MIRRREGNSVVAPACIASAATALALLLPSFILSPNRVVPGDPLYLPALDPATTAAIVLLWILYFVFSAFGGRTLSRIAVLLPFLLMTACLVATLAACRRADMAPFGAGAAARVSLGSSFWFALLMTYVAYVYASRLAASPAWLGAAGVLAVFVVAAALARGGGFGELAILREWSAQRGVFAAELGRHAALAGGAVVAGGILGSAVGATAARSKSANSWGFVALNVVQTIPSLALFGFLIIPLAALVDRFPALRDWGIGGIGPAPALIALSLYAALPVARNTAAALTSVPASALDAGRGMGMGPMRLFLRVELPLALPVALSGVRTAAVQAVGNAAVAALIGAGGLGVFIFQGLGQFAMDMVLLGTLPLVAMALLVDAVMAGLVSLCTPRAFAVRIPSEGVAG